MKKKYITFSQSINEALHQAMSINKNVFVFGQGVDKTGHVFHTTEGLLKKFGKKRIFDTPNSEQAETLFAAGAAINGLRPVLIHHRVDFMAYSFDQLINWISLWSFKSSRKSFLPLVIRAIIGKGWGQGPQHAKTLHAMFSYLPGLRVVMPSSPSEAKGLLLSSIMCNDPVVFLEYRALYNTKELVPTDTYFIDLEQPRLRLSGNELTVIAAGASVLTSLNAAERLIKEKSINIDLFDLRSLSKVNMENIYKSVSKTKKLVIVEDGWSNFGLAAELIAKISENGCILTKPPKRICWPNSHIPMSTPLEKDFYFDVEDIFNACLKLVKD